MAGRKAADPLDTDVVICGSGVAGLAAARALGRLGLDVVLLDKKLRQPPLWKGEVLQPGSLGTLRAWDVLRARFLLGAGKAADQHTSPSAGVRFATVPKTFGNI